MHKRLALLLVLSLLSTQASAAPTTDVDTVFEIEVTNKGKSTSRLLEVTVRGDGATSEASFRQGSSLRNMSFDLKVHRVASSLRCELTVSELDGRRTYKTTMKASARILGRRTLVSSVASASGKRITLYVRAKPRP